MEPQEVKCCKVVVTGGPGGGKTTAIDLFRREIGDEVVVVPEAATILYSGGFPRSSDTKVRWAIQKAIYHVQINLEEAQSVHSSGKILLCDRGTVDGAVYWPGESLEFFSALNTSLQQEFLRYDAVLFFETAAVGGIQIEGGNPVRKETIQEAIELDKKLRFFWSQHPRFTFVPHDVSFMRKINLGLSQLAQIVEDQQKIR